MDGRLVGAARHLDGSGPFDVNIKRSAQSFSA
jgi:hypothetical protein